MSESLAASSTNEGLCLITVNGAKDLAVPQNTMGQATFSAPEIDGTAPIAPARDVTNGPGYFVSPCYFKGTKTADAVDVLWRYNGEGEEDWRSVKAEAESSSGEAVVADTWWWCEISLEHKLTQGQTTNVTAPQRAVGIEIATIDAAGNISTPVSKTLNWNIAHIGDTVPANNNPNHLIQQGEKMILAGPADPGQLPSGDKTITITGDDIPTPLSASYTEANTPNWIVEFDTEGNHRTHTATITLDADSSTLSSTSTDIHVIKKLRVEVIALLPEKPNTWYKWAIVFWKAMTGAGAWTWNNGDNEASYALMRVPAAASDSAWASYEVTGGEPLVPSALHDLFPFGRRLWWSQELDDDYEDIAIEASYGSCVLQHDSALIVLRALPTATPISPHVTWSATSAQKYGFDDFYSNAKVDLNMPYCWKSLLIGSSDTVLSNIRVEGAASPSTAYLKSNTPIPLVAKIQPQTVSLGVSQGAVDYPTVVTLTAAGYAGSGDVVYRRGDPDTGEKLYSSLGIEVFKKREYKLGVVRVQDHTEVINVPVPTGALESFLNSSVYNQCCLKFQIRDQYCPVKK